MGTKIIELNDSVMSNGVEVYDRIMINDELVIRLSEKEYELYYGKEIYSTNVREKLLTMFFEAAEGKNSSYLSFDVGTIFDSKNVQQKVRAVRIFSEDECIQGVFIPTNQYSLLIENIDLSIHKILFNLPEQIIKIAWNTKVIMAISNN